MPKVFKAAAVIIDQNEQVTIKSGLPQGAAPFIASDTNRPEDAPTAENRLTLMARQAEKDADETRKAAEIAAAALLADTRNKADALIQEATVNAAQMEEDAQRAKAARETEGYQEGVAKAEEACRATLAAAEAEAQTIVENALAERDALRASTEPEVVDLILRIVEKLLNDAVQVNPAAVLCLLRRGFAEATISADTQVTVRVAASDYDTVVAHRDELTALAGGTTAPQIVKDVNLPPLGCAIETQYGVIDCSPQFEAIRENLIYLSE